MLIHPQFNPVAIQLGPLAIHWYGLMYLLAFLQFWFLGRRRIRTHPQLIEGGWTVEQLDDLLFYGVLGVILGRLLGPQPFGLVAAALLPIGLGQLLVDQGVSAELVQRSRLDSGDLRRARNRQLVMGAGLGLSLALTAPMLAAWPMQ